MQPEACTMPARVVAREFDPERDSVRSAIFAYCATEPIRVGRENCDLACGVDPVDVKVSRTALVISATPHGWGIAVMNANGVRIHEWGKRGEFYARGRRALRRAPRVGVHVIGSSAFEGATEHWVLLENDAFFRESGVVPRAGSEPTRTLQVEPPALTHKERQAIDTVFAEHLAWPPRSAPRPRSMSEAAELIVDCGATGVQERLKRVKLRVDGLGSGGEHTPSDPAYAYALAEYGCLTPPHLHEPAEPLHRS